MADTAASAKRALFLSLSAAAAAQQAVEQPGLASLVGSRPAADKPRLAALVGRATSSAGRRPSPSGRSASPSGRAASPSGRAASPLGRTATSANRPISTAGRFITAGDQPAVERPASTAVQSGHLSRTIEKEEAVEVGSSGYAGASEKPTTPKLKKKGVSRLCRRMFCEI